MGSIVSKPLLESLEDQIDRFFLFKLSVLEVQKDSLMIQGIPTLNQKSNFKSLISLKVSILGETMDHFDKEWSSILLLFLLRLTKTLVLDQKTMYLIGLQCNKKSKSETVKFWDLFGHLFEKWPFINTLRKLWFMYGQD